MTVRVLVVAGPAGSGKSTLGAALAAELGSALLDQDTLTNALLDALWPNVSPDGHWNDPRYRAVVRPARYAVLRSAAADQVAAGVDTVLVAPFTAELAGGSEWDALVSAVRPATPEVIWLDALPDLLRSRVVERGERRDAFTTASARAQRPAVPHRRIEASLPTTVQVAVVLAAPPP